MIEAGDGSYGADAVCGNSCRSDYGGDVAMKVNLVV
jgi:hypothetical protein